MEASKETQAYFKEIESKLGQAYKVASAARKKGFDPEEKVDIPLANTLGQRVEGLVSAVAPQLMGSGVAKRIKELEKSYGALAIEVALKIAEEVANESFCKFRSKKEAMEVGIRTGFAYFTAGMVAAPLEGFIELKIKKRRDGKEYLTAAYAGPVRGAGGTACSVSVIITDYIRKIMGYDTYDPTPDEVSRFIIELEDYHERVTNLQYRPSPAEVRFLMSRVPVEIDGDPTERIEVSNYKDLPRVETNRIRGGVCLVVSMMTLKAPKLYNYAEKLKHFGLDWGFLKGFLEIQKRAKAKTEIKKGELAPDATFITDLVAGRPVLTYPLASGGFRLRYGRTRISGYSAVGINPATMLILKRYIATGTQLKIERPGKAAAVTPCDSIEGPIIKIDDGSVVRIFTESAAREILPQIKEVLFLGDILISYGDFFDRSHRLVSIGYCEEFYAQELEKAIVDTFGVLDTEKLASITEIPANKIGSILKNPLETIPNANMALRISKELGIALHPYYTYHWKLISSQELMGLIEWFSKAKIKTEARKIILPLDESKRSLERIGVPHKIVQNEFVVIEEDDAEIVSACLNLPNLEQSKSTIRKNIDKKALELINLISQVKLRDKSGTFIGARMGRPEKAKMRRLTGSPQVLFPVGDQGGRLRSFQSALEKGFVTADFPLFFCQSCKRKTIYPVCEVCEQKTQKHYFCSICGEVENCRHRATSFRTQQIDIGHYFEYALKRLKTKTFPDLIKGVRGTSNKDHIPENLVKGLLRAKHEIYVNKDGTTRYDMTELPITHFKPKEINASIEKLRSLGYVSDVKGKPLENKEQVLELKPQDLILPASTESTDESSNNVLFKVSRFTDELLTKFYGQKAFYNLKNKEELIGHLVIGLAPHTSAGAVGRIIGFSRTQALFAHPLFHAAMRRDCLEYNTTIPLCENNIWKIKKIGEIVEELKPTQKVDAFGTLQKKVKSMKTISLNPKNNKLETVDIKAFTKHTPTRLIEIKTRYGRKIKLTYNHKVFVLKNKEIIGKKAYELKKGDKLISPHKIKIPSKDVKYLDLLGLFKNRKDIMVRGINKYVKQLIADQGGQKRLRERLKIKKSTVHNYLSRDSIPITFLQKLLQMNNKSLKDLPQKCKIAIKRDTAELKPKIPLNKDVLEFIGLYVAEGFARKRSDKKGFYQISIAASNPEIKNKIRQTAKKYFNLLPSEDHEDHLTFSSRILYELFIEVLKTGHSAKTKRIPFIILNLPIKKLAAFLRGYYEGDGSVSITDLRVSCDSVSQGLLADLEFALARFGFFIRKYQYEKQPGPKVRMFYEKKKKRIPKFKITKLTIPSNFCKEFHEQINFISKRKRKILKNLIETKRPRGTKAELDEQFAYLQIEEIKPVEKQPTYCLELNHHNFLANNLLVHNCDGDEACVILLMDALLNFSRQYLPDKRGSRTMDAPLVLTSIIIPSEVDDMVHRMDVAWNYPLEFYQAAQEHKNPWETKIEQLGSRLGTPDQYQNIGFTHKISDMNTGVSCSAYKTLPSMEDKLKGQMEIAEKLRAVDASDVARLVIEKHLLKDIKGNLRKFSIQQFRCVNCNQKFRRPPLNGKCVCGGRIIFTISEGSIIKYLEPAISLAKRYDVDDYTKQSLQLMKLRIEEVFGREKERQEGLGKWFG